MVNPGKSETAMKVFSAKAIENRSITWRLAASIALTVLVVSVIAFAVFNWLVSHEAARALDKKADETLAYLVGSLEMPLWTANYNEIRIIGQAVANDESIARLVIRDRSGAVVHAVERQTGDGLVNRSGQVFFRQGNQRSLAGDVTVSLSPIPFRTANQRQLIFLIFVIFLILISVVSVTVVLIRTSLNKPLHSLSEIARRFAAGAYDPSGHTLPYLEFQPFKQALVQMERTVAEQFMTLKEAEAKCRKIFENAVDGVFQSAPDGRFLNANPALLGILGYESLDELSASVREVSKDLYLGSEARDKLLALLDRQGAVAGYEVPLRRRDGQVIWVSISARMVRGEAGVPLSIEGFLRDINDRKRIQEEILERNRELEQRLAECAVERESTTKELKDLTYSVSHDLRAPLRHIDGFLGLLKERIAPTLDEESQRYMATISAAALRMAALIDDLLAFSRSGCFEMTRAQVDLGELVKEVIREFEPETRGRIIHWDVAELPAVSGDRAMLRVVLSNLISNALKFTQPRAQAEIGIGCLSGDETETIVFVRDNGVGFDMRYADKLFGVFERLHGVDEFKGAGIGLANIRRIISRHGGRTWAEGKVDGGAAFYFSLPRAGAP
jgi:PAS domain S-box-containing protein